MNEYYIREKVVATAKSYLGCKESDGSHKRIIDLYNGHTPLARSYKVKYTDSWCATFVSVVAILCGYTDIMPTECSCQKMIELYKKIGRFVEADNYIPKIADIIMYDWDDNGSGDNTGWADHVGIVTSIVGDTMTIIEGNYSNSVKYRTLKVNGKYIRGYCVPDYASKATKASGSTPTTPKATVWEFQNAAIADGFKFPKYGADGKWGSECEAVAKKAIVKRRLIHTNKNLTKLVQRVVGVTVDGKCGPATKEAIIHYQKSMGLVADGEVGINTWKKILEVD